MSAAREAKPRLARGARLKRDETRETWIVNAPERVLVLDDTAYAILSLCDGVRSVADIAAMLAEAHDTTADTVETDILAFIDELQAKGYVSL